MEGFLIGAGAVFLIAVSLPTATYVAGQGWPKWLRLPRRTSKFRKQLLEYVAWDRETDRRAYGITEADWNRVHLDAAVERYQREPRYYRKKMLNSRRSNELLDWVKDNDPSVLREKIRKLEQELDFDR